MRLTILILLFFLVSFTSGFMSVVSAAYSISNTSFTTSGCNYNGESIADLQCSTDGRIFCNLSEANFGNNVKRDTLTDKYACSKGKTSFANKEDVIKAGTCCPKGSVKYICDTNLDGNDFVCKPTSKICSECPDSDCCIALQCDLWSDSYGCIDDVHDLSCSFYRNNTECGNDTLEIGKYGIGSESCGQYYSSGFGVRPDSCHCEWWGVLPVGNYCNLTWELIDTDPPLPCAGGCKSGGCIGGTGLCYNDPIGSFICSKNFYQEDCIDGKQFINWSATVKSLSVTGNFTDQAFLDKYRDETNCWDGNTTRLCGTPAVRVPGFSLFALISSLIIIASVYFLRKNSYYH